MFSCGDSFFDDQLIILIKFEVVNKHCTSLQLNRETKDLVGEEI